MRMSVCSVFTELLLSQNDNQETFMRVRVYLKISFLWYGRTTALFNFLWNSAGSLVSVREASKHKREKTLMRLRNQRGVQCVLFRKLRVLY